MVMILQVTRTSSHPCASLVPALHSELAQVFEPLSGHYSPGYVLLGFHFCFNFFIWDWLIVLKAGNPQDQVFGITDLLLCVLLFCF